MGSTPPTHTILDPQIATCGAGNFFGKQIVLCTKMTDFSDSRVVAGNKGYPLRIMLRGGGYSVEVIPRIFKRI